MLTDISVSRGRCSSDVSMGAAFLELRCFVCVGHFFFYSFLSRCVSYLLFGFSTRTNGCQTATVIVEMCES